MDYEALLNAEQVTAVKDTQGQVLVLAGAGSGKTRVLTYRIAYLIGELGVSPYNILAITFTNKAANEMKERVLSVTGESGVWVSTFHSMCARILRYEIEALGYGKNFTIYTENESERLIVKILKAMGVDDASKYKADCRWHISNAKNHLKSPDEYAKITASARCGDLAVEVYERYEKELMAANALDFDDLLVKTVELFRQFPEILEKYKSRFEYVLVDEFQDTNAVQFLLVRMLAGRDGNLFVVGDDDQSIYGWRGAEVANILAFEKFYPAVKVYKLERNYRSTANILNCANEVIKYNKGRRGKQLWTEKEKGVKVEYCGFYDDRAEADNIVKQIDGLRRCNGYSYGDFAVLMRVNSLSRVMEEKFNMNGMPFKLYGGFKFYDRKEIRDVLAYLRLLSNPSDNDALLRVINFPKRGIGDGAVAKLGAYCAACGFGLFDGVLNIENSDLPASVSRRICEFKNVMNDLKEAQGRLKLGDFIDYLVERVDFTTEFDRFDSEGENKLMNIDELVVAVKDFCKDNPDAGVDEYLQQVSLISDTDSMGQNDDFITLSTVHSVKGLEFRCVFIIGLEEGIFPVSRALDNPADMEEERRIMYVALTRARERLYLSNTSQRFRYGRIENNVASRFLKEAGVLKPVDVSDLPRKSEKPYLSDIAGYAKQYIGKNTSESKDISAFKPGAKVVHRTFGEGEIVEVSGEAAKIRFEKLGVKQFNLRIAPVELKR